MLHDYFQLEGDILLLPARVVYIKSIRALVLADVHIGIEFSAAVKGVFLPSVQYSEIKDLLNDLLIEYHPDKLIIVGDFKHEFSRKTTQELREIVDMLEFIESFGIDFVLVRGNHDNFLRGFLDDFKVTFVEPFYSEGKYTFIHGHQDIPLDDIPGDFIIMGHEHPSILLVDDVGAKAKVPVFLFGEFKDKRILVLPAFSPLAPGSEINVLRREDLLSPILRNIPLDRFRIYPALSKGLLPPIELKDARLVII